MRTRYLVCYDVADARRLQRIGKVMRGFGGRQQYSVFQCDLSPRERVEMIAALTTVLHQREDRVMIVDLGPTMGRGCRCTEYLGQYPEPAPTGARIV